VAHELERRALCLGQPIEDLPEAIGDAAGVHDVVGPAAGGRDVDLLARRPPRSSLGLGACRAATYR
jgi:hypothetical protein